MINGREEPGKMEETIQFSHKSVLLEECMEGLNIRPQGIYIDGTAGGAGHSKEIASRLGEGGRLIALDQDEAAIRTATERLSVFGDRATVVRSNFREVGSVCEMLGIEQIDGMLLDLGVSSYQLDTAERGFSYQADAPLDMRMDMRNELTAYHVVNEYSEERIKRILFDYGEERFSGRIASAILKARGSSQSPWVVSDSNHRGTGSYRKECDPGCCERWRTPSGKTDLPGVAHRGQLRA